MKLAYLANVRFPSERAHSTQIAHMCQSFAQNGVGVDLFAKSSSQVSVENAYGFQPLFTISGLSAGYFNPRIQPTFYLSEVFFTLNFLFKLRKQKYDIIYSRNEWAVWILSLFISDKKLVWESHEAKYNFPARRILAKGIKTIVISDAIQDDYISYGISSEQMLVAYDGIDESFYGEVEDKESARTRLGLTLDAKIAMYIGGFDEWKGIRTFLEAAKIAPDVLFVTIGGSKEEVARYQEQFPEVKFLGALPYSHLRNNQQAADVLVVPNTAKSDLSARYTSPLKLFAHMASGVPLVASDIPSISSVVTDTQATFFAPDDAGSLSTNILKVFKFYPKYLSASASLKEYSRQYLWLNRANSIVSFIK